MSSHSRLPDLEKRLQNRLSPDGAGLSLSDDESHELLQAFRKGAMVASTVAPRFEAFPTASYALAKHLANQDEPFWPTLETKLLGRQHFGPDDRRKAREALDQAVQKFGIHVPNRLRLATETNGLHSFKIRHQGANKIQVILSWFGPYPSDLKLVLANDNCPWLKPEQALLDLSTLKQEGEEVEIDVELPELAPGHYQVHAVCGASGSVILNRKSKTAFASFAIGTEEEVTEAVEKLDAPAKEFFTLLDTEDYKSKDRKQLMRQSLVRFVHSNDDISVLGECFQSCANAPTGSRGSRLFKALNFVFRRLDAQTKLVAWAKDDEARIRVLAEHSLPSITLPKNCAELCEGKGQAWYQSGQKTAALIVLGDRTLSVEDKTVCFGPMVESWGDKELGDSDRIRIEVNGREYVLVVEGQEEEVVSGLLTTFDGDDIEVELKPLGGGEYNLVPELARRQLFTCECGTLVTDLRECPGAKDSKTKEGKPVSIYSPVTARIKKPRSRPASSLFIEGTGDARRLALATSRRVSSTESDQDIVRMLLDFAGPYTDQAAYGQAMLEWAIPLASADDNWKKMLWAIDREAKTFKQAASDLSKRALERIPTQAAHLLEDYQRLYLQRKIQPAPLALERAVLDVAVTARCVARQDVADLPEDIIETLARIEDLVNEICPALLRWFSNIVELILDDGIHG